MYAEFDLAAAACGLSEERVDRSAETLAERYLTIARGLKERKAPVPRVPNPELPFRGGQPGGEGGQG